MKNKVKVSGISVFLLLIMLFLNPSTSSATSVIRLTLDFYSENNTQVGTGWLEWDYGQFEFDTWYRVDLLPNLKQMIFYTHHIPGTSETRGYVFEPDPADWYFYSSEGDIPTWLKIIDENPVFTPVFSMPEMPSLETYYQDMQGMLNTYFNYSTGQVTMYAEWWPGEDGVYAFRDVNNDTNSTGYVQASGTVQLGVWFDDPVPLTSAVVPIPGAVYLFGSGLIGLAGFRRKFKK